MLQLRELWKVGWILQGIKLIYFGANYQSIGIGCFYFDGRYYWVQCFSWSEAEETATKQSNSTSAFSIYVGDDYIDLAVSSNYVTVKPGESTNITIKNRTVACNSNCATWKSSDTSIATVDSNGNIKGIKNGKTTITVTLGTDTKTITVFVQQYTDVKDTWYTEYVNYCSENGIMTGYTGTSRFGPNDKTTRGQIVTILYRLEGEPSVSGSSSFSDVKNTSKYYYKAVLWANKNGIVTGYGTTGLFMPDKSVTREELVTILYRYAKYDGKYEANDGSLSGFSDGSKVSEYAKDAMKWAIGEGIISGYGSTGLIKPQGTATRAEIATMIYRYINL